MSQKTMFETKCTKCGQTTTVPFKPTKGKPVYCEECFSKRSRKRELNTETVNFNSKLAWARRRHVENTSQKRKPKRAFRKFSHAVQK